VPGDALPERPLITRASLSPQPRALPSETPTAAAGAADRASAASLFPRADAPEASENAVARSLVPAARPGNMETLIANAVRPEPQAPAAVIEAAAIAPGPSIPSNADVARAATQSNALRLREVNLIGVTGTASDRRALVRLPSGRFVRVGVGDRLNGGRVAAIGASTLQYVRSGRTVTLDIPG
jgi:L-fucose isomerase-like protein